MLDLLHQLNPPQREAVERTEGPLLVIAGAGSGKTRVITYRIAYLIRERGVAPGSIFAATFTNRAAAEMKERVGRILGYSSPPYMSIATFHSLCARILRQEAYLIGLSNRFIIADDRDCQALMGEVMKDLGIGKDVMTPSMALWMVSQLKMRMLPPEAAGELMASQLANAEDAFDSVLDQHAALSTPAELLTELVARYQARLRSGDAVDFDDLILYTVQIFEQHPDVLALYHNRFRYLLVDEYQDTNLSQFRLVELLARGHRNICVVGDEDQSIYSWRGAELSNLLEFQKHYPDAGLIKLEQNYRSTGHVLAAASAVIAHNTERIGKTLWTELGDGLPIGLHVAQSDLEEADTAARLCEEVRRRTGYSWRDMAVFYRVKSLSRTYEEAMRARDIPYRVVGGTSFYERAEIRDMLAYLRLAVNPHQTLSLLRVINTPRRGVGQKTLDELMQRSAQRGESLYQAILGSVADGSLKGKARQALGDLCDQMKGWMQAAVDEEPHLVLRRVLEETGYVAGLGDPEHIEVKGRISHIEELEESLRSAREEHPGQTLDEWLENVALRAEEAPASSEEAQNDDARDVVSLMTLHAAKGLEFPVVMMVGLEDPIFPNARAVEERGNIEEERRLMYVGITRAQRLLVLMCAGARRTHGELRFNAPSIFLHEVPRELTADLHQLDIAHINEVQRGSLGSQESLIESENRAREQRESADSGTQARRPNPYGAGPYNAGSGRPRPGASAPRRSAMHTGGHTAQQQQAHLSNILNKYGGADRGLPSYARPEHDAATPNAALLAAQRATISEVPAPPSVAPPAGELHYESDDGELPLFGTPVSAPRATGSATQGSPPPPRRPNKFAANPAQRPAGKPRATTPASSGPQASASPAKGEPLAWAVPGVRVHHSLLGAGRITAVTGSGPNRKLLIQFDNGSPREMLAAYAHLTREATS